MERPQNEDNVIMISKQLVEKGWDNLKNMVYRLKKIGIQLGKTLTLKERKNGNEITNVMKFINTVLQMNQHFSMRKVSVDKATNGDQNWRQLESLDMSNRYEIDMRCRDMRLDNKRQI